MGAIASLAALQVILWKDNGEPLVHLEDIYPEILCDYSRKEGDLKTVLVRQSVASKLIKVHKRLHDHDAHLQLLVVEGYRTPAYQEAYFLKQLLATHQKDPHRNFEDLVEEAHQCVALPSVAGHPTGGAVDLTLAYAGQELDMGGMIADFSLPELLPTYSVSASPDQVKRRGLLHDLMIAEGFAPFYGEWWHFSYGDREWAAFYHKPETLYSPSADGCLRE